MRRGGGAHRERMKKGRERNTHGSFFTTRTDFAKKQFSVKTESEEQKQEIWKRIIIKKSISGQGRASRKSGHTWEKKCAAPFSPGEKMSDHFLSSAVVKKWQGMKWIWHEKVKRVDGVWSRWKNKHVDTRIISKHKIPLNEWNGASGFFAVCF